MKLLTRSALTLALSLASAPLLAAGLADGDAAAGQGKAAVCAACHGADGNAPAAMYPKLAGQGAPYLEKQLHDFQSGKRQDAIMQGMAAPLSDTDIEDLAAWFSSQTGTTGQADPKLVKQGEAIFRGGIPAKGVAACSACHGPAGQGIISASFPKLAGQHAEYVEAQLKAFRASGRNDLGDGIIKRSNDRTGDAAGPMETLAARLSDEEIKQVASYIAGLSK
jgi:cytochrome c553